MRTRREGRIRQTQWVVYAVILAVVTLSYASVLFTTYLRQDDFNAMTWVRRQVWGHADFYNSAVELFRPVSVLIIIVSDWISYHMAHAWITRGMNVLLIGFSAILTYRWLRLMRSERVFAVCFAISSVMLPGFNIIASTGGYTVMIFSVIFSQLACFKVYQGHLHPERRRRHEFIGALYMLLSLLGYPLGSTYIFAFLLMYCLAHLEEAWWKRASFALRATLFTFACMAFVFVAAKLFFLIFHIVPRDPQRAVAVNWDIPNKLLHWQVMLCYAFNFFDLRGVLNAAGPHFAKSVWGSMFAANSPGPGDLIVWMLLLMAGAWGYLRNQAHRKPASGAAALSLGVAEAKMFLAVLGLVTLAYIPALPPRYEGGYAFRYGLVTTPTAFYGVVWSLAQLLDYLRGRKSLPRASTRLALYGLTLLSALLGAHHVYRYIAGANDHEFSYLRSQIDKKAVPLLEAGQKVTLYVTSANAVTSMPNGFQSLEYGFGFSHHTAGFLLAASIYTMRDAGYESIETDPPYHIIAWDNYHVQFETKWGYIFTAMQGQPKMPVPSGTQEVDVNMDDNGVFW